VEELQRQLAEAGATNRSLLANMPSAPMGGQSHLGQASSGGSQEALPRAASWGKVGPPTAELRLDAGGALVSPRTPPYKLGAQLSSSSGSEVGGAGGWVGAMVLLVATCRCTCSSIGGCLPACLPGCIA